MLPIDRARALLRQFTANPLFVGEFDAVLRLQCRHCRPGIEGFVPRRSWIQATVNTRTSSGPGLMNAQHLRAFLEIVGQLCALHDLSWRDFYTTFWREALMEPLGIALLRDFLFTDPAQSMPGTAAIRLSMLTRGAHSRDWKPRIELEVTLVLRDTPTVHLRDYARLFEDFAVHEQQKVAGGGAFRFEITTFLLSSTGRLLSEVDVHILSDMITAESATIRHLVIENAMMMLPMGETLQAYHQFLCAAVCCSGDSTKGLQTLQIRKAPISSHGHLMAVCSALRYKNSLRELNVEWPRVISRYLFNKSAVLWAWIAFGIFHPDSEAKLDNLRLSSLPLRRRVDMEAFESTKLRQFVRLRAPVVREVDKHKTEEFEAAILFSSRAALPTTPTYFGDNIRVFSADNNGKEAEDTYAVAVDAATLDQGENDFGYSPPDGIADIKSLLQMIGHGLEGFEYPLHEIEISEADLDEILESCPNLRQLNLQKNPIAGITPLLNRYRSGLCQIATLSIYSKVEIDRILAHVAQLLMAPFSKLLQFLEVNGLVNNRDHLAFLGRALNMNRTLQVLSVKIASAEGANKLLREQTNLKCNLRPKLSLSTKIAFLSVIHEHATRPSREPRLASLAKLDSSVVAEIFGFAGSTVTRSIDVHGAALDDFVFQR
ncbi:hypothetical protein PybrP1_012267 [[Pythium] brassicae (nom. inval.)]|nr:hypothetical protein PybrP1_012267 [[Pythium] brassicae (nom. inval.)]